MGKNMSNLHLISFQRACKPFYQFLKTFFKKKYNLHVVLINIAPQVPSYLIFLESFAVCNEVSLSKVNVKLVMCLSTCINNC